jgi:copper resistance protein B
MKNILNKIVITSTLMLSLYSGEMNDDQLNYKATFERLEVELDEEKSNNWDANIWAGYDLNKIYLYSEGEKTEHETSNENQLLLSKAILPYWDIQYGLGYDNNDDNDTSWLVLSLMGMAPYFLETKTTILIGKSNIAIRANIEHETLITQNLTLMYGAEISAYSKDDAKMKTGKGLSTLSMNLRLTYKIKREFMPYIGLNNYNTFGNTNKMEPNNKTDIAIGISVWF